MRLYGSTKDSCIVGSMWSLTYLSRHASGPVLLQTVQSFLNREERVTFPNRTTQSIDVNSHCLKGNLYGKRKERKYDSPPLTFPFANDVRGSRPASHTLRREMVVFFLEAEFISV